MSIYSNFERITKTNNILYKPSPRDQYLGAHAVVCIGYNDINRTFIILNSHGKDWGNNGLFYMSYDLHVIKRPRLGGLGNKLIEKRHLNIHIIFFFIIIFFKCIMFIII